MTSNAPTIEVEIKTKTTIRLSMESAATWFSSLSDDDQAKFFVEVARIAREGFPDEFSVSQQWFYIGNHLRTCECATEEAREMIRGIARAIDWKDAA